MISRRVDTTTVGTVAISVALLGNCEAHNRTVAMYMHAGGENYHLGVDSSSAGGSV